MNTDKFLVGSSAKGTMRTRKHGFALVATLTLMMLLGLIAVGILAVASSQNRIAAQTILQAEARQHALIGLDAAIADLQMEVGPDQRVTASSGILSEDPSTPQHILGVWNSWQAPLYGSSGGATIGSTYTQGRASMFRRWLISCNNVTTQRQFQAISDLGRSKPGQRICMVGEGTLGAKASDREYVYADLISMPSAGRNETCFAWWVGGENQKVNVAVKDREPTNDPVEILRRTWDTPAPDFRGSQDFSFMPEKIDNPEKILTLRTLPLVDRGSVPAGTPYFFDATTFSYSLLTNVRDGGLKLDLNTLLNKRDLRGTPFQARRDQDCPIAEGEGLPTGTEASMPIGSWQVMHAYYNMWPDGSGRNEDFESSRLMGNVTNSYSRMVGDLVRAKKKALSGKSYNVTYFSDRVEEGDLKAGYARVPILLSFIAKYGLSVTKPQCTWGNKWPNPGAGKDNDQWMNAGTRGMAACYAPVVLWWNPYNVQMRVGAKKLWMHSLPYRTTNITYAEGQTGNNWKRLFMLQPTDTGGYKIDDTGWMGQRHFFGNDWGNYFVYSKEDQTSEIIFEPGEILLFSMAEGFDNMNAERKLVEAGINPGDGRDDVRWTMSLPQNIPFVQGDQVGYLYNYFASVFGSHEYSGQVNQKTLRIAFETRGSYNSIERNNSQFLESYLGDLSGKKYLHDTAGEDLGPSMREMFVVPHGYNGIDTSKVERIVERSTTLREARPSALVDAYPGAEGISPYVFSLGWYDYDTASVDDLTFVGGKGNEEARFSWDMYGSDGDEVPNYYAAAGIAPKSYNRELLNAVSMFREKDYRTRSWLHSNPALGGGELYKPDDQMRQYHPFQLAAYKLTDATAMDMLNSKNGIYGLQAVATGGGEAVSFISVLELPVHPPFSLAGFSGMRLKPGWFGEDDFGDEKALSQMRRMQYQAGVPGVGIGNSFADPTIPPDDVYAFHQTKINSSISKNGQLFSDFFDHGFIINDALWDRWFCSSVSDMPSKTGRIPARETLEAFVREEEPLPVSRYKMTRTSADQEQIIERIMADDGWKRIASYLIVEGGFNVNSVSEEAWFATLMGLAKRELVSNTQGTLHTVEHTPKENVLFSRFGVSTADRSMDTRSDYNVLLGAAFLRPSMQMATAWGDVRSLTPESIRRLAHEICKKVRERGPFLNMADFINRRLDGGSDAALCGALQAAIDATQINERFNLGDFRIRPLAGDFYRFPRAEEGSMYTAAPGYLIQSDVLASLGNILTVRDDTFVVRAYGCVRNAHRAILAQAWCEAVVQRTIDFVDPTNSPEEGSYDPVNQGSRNAARPVDSLTEVNRIMGRRLHVVSFKWLDSWDI